MFTFECLRKCLHHRLPSLWTKCNNVVSYVPRVFVHTSLMFSVKSITDPVDKLEVKSLTSKSLIQNASAVTVTSTTQLAVLSGSVLMDHYKDYRCAMEKVLVLMDEMLMFLNSESHQEKIWLEMVSARSELDDIKKALVEMESFMEYIEKLVTAAADAAYLAGSEFSSTAICESFNSIQQKLADEQRKTKDLETEYNRQQQSFIKTMTEKGRIPSEVEDTN